MTERFPDFGKGVRFILVILLFCWAAPLWAQPSIQISFGPEDIGKLPSGWLALNGINAAKVYSVRIEGEKKYIHAEAKGQAIQIGYSKKWVLKEYPILQWQWRPLLFPLGSNEQEKSRNDSVLGLYVVFGTWPFIKAIKYIWSDTLPVGVTFNSTYSKGTKVVVLRSGRSLQGTWVSEKRDVFLDYQQLFGDGEKNPVASGIALLTDADHTNSQAIGDYAEIKMLGALEERSGPR